MVNKLCSLFVEKYHFYNMKSGAASRFAAPGGRGLGPGVKRRQKQGGHQGETGLRPGYIFDIVSRA